MLNKFSVDSAYSPSDSALMGQDHDTLFKATFERPETAAAHLRDSLPADARERLDLSTLAVEPASFVDSEAAEARSDLLFSVQTSGSEDRAFVYVLFEHHSTHDPQMAWRLLRYIVRIWRRWERAQSGPDATRLLPPVIPLVVYNGESAWTSSTHFANRLQPTLHETALADTSPDFRFVPQRVAGIPVREMPGDAVGRLALALLGSRADSFLQVLRGLRDDLKQDRDVALLTFEFVITYVLRRSAIAEDELFETIRPLGPDYEEVAMNTAQMLEERGMKRGIEQGIERGIEQAQVGFAERLLWRGEAPRAVAELTGLSIDMVIRLVRQRESQ